MIDKAAVLDNNAAVAFKTVLMSSVRVGGTSASALLPYLDSEAISSQASRTRQLDFRPAYQPSITMDQEFGGMMAQAQARGGAQPSRGDVAVPDK